MTIDSVKISVLTVASILSFQSAVLAQPVSSAEEAVGFTKQDPDGKRHGVRRKGVAPAKPTRTTPEKNDADGKNYTPPTGQKHSPVKNDPNTAAGGAGVTKSYTPRRP